MMDEQLLGRIDLVTRALTRNHEAIKKTGFSEWTPEDGFMLSMLIDDLEADGRFKGMLEFFQKVQENEITVR